MISEKTYRPLNGWLPLLIILATLVGGPWMLISGAIGLGHYGGSRDLIFLVAGIAIFLLGILGLFGFMAIAPNQARVLLLFGKYKGSALESGFFWVNPFFSKKKISLRIRNFETGSV